MPSLENWGGGLKIFCGMYMYSTCIHGLWHTLLQNPDGSLQRAALTQSALSKERRELRAAQREADMDNVPRDIGKTWIDPVPGGTGTGGTFIHVYIANVEMWKVRHGN